MWHCPGGRGRLLGPDLCQVYPGDADKGQLVVSQQPRRAQRQGVHLRRLPLPHALPQPLGTPHENSQRREALQVPTVRLRLSALRQPQASPPSAHGREALQVPFVRLRLREPGQPEAPPAGALGRQTLPVCRVQLQLQPEHEPEAAHAAAHGGKAVQVSGVRLHHRPLGQLQAAPEEARPGHGRLGQGSNDWPRRGRGGGERDGGRRPDSQEGGRS